MNESEYLQYLQQRMGKVGESGMKYLNPRMLDKVYGGDQISRQFALQDIGSQNKINESRLGLAQQRSDFGIKKMDQDYDTRKKTMAQNYDTSKSAFKDAEGAMDTAHYFDMAGLGVGYLQGQNLSQKERESAELIRRQTKALEGLVR